MRSLSCEVCPGREGPIVFSDDQEIHCLSYMFKIADARVCKLGGTLVDAKWVGAFDRLVGKPGGIVLLS